MGRSVVLAGAARCPRCSLPPRWCTCDMLPPAETQLTVQVLIHLLEQCRPSSTGKLVGRAVAGAACHVYQRGNRFFPATGYSADALQPERELWVLHPSGDSLPESAAAEAADSSHPGRCFSSKAHGGGPTRYWRACTAESGASGRPRPPRASPAASGREKMPGEAPDARYPCRVTRNRPNTTRPIPRSTSAPELFVPRRTAAPPSPEIIISPPITILSTNAPPH